MQLFEQTRVKKTLAVFVRLSLVLGVLLGWSSCLSAAENVAAKLTDVAKEIKKAVEAKGENKVGVVWFSGPPRYGSNGGEGLAHELREALKALKITVDNKKANLLVHGAYAPATDPENPENTVLKVAMQLRDMENNQIGKDHVAYLRGVEVLARFLGPTTRLPGGPPTGDAARVRDDIAKPKFYADGTRISTAKGSPLSVEILVRASDNAPLQAQTPKNEEGQAFVDIKIGEVYEIHLHNKSDKDVVAMVTIDGLDVFTFSDVRDEKTGRPKYPGYFVKKNSTFKVKGWHKTNEVSLEFLVERYGKGASSDAAVASTGENGVITVAFAGTFSGKPRLAGLSLPEDKKTGAGKPLKTDYKETTVYIDKIKEIVSVRYSQKKAKEKR